jgi:hypothetical protein
MFIKNRFCSVGLKRMDTRQVAKIHQPRTRGRIIMKRKPLVQMINNQEDECKPGSGYESGRNDGAALVKTGWPAAVEYRQPQKAGQQVQRPVFGDVLNRQFTLAVANHT